MIKEMGKVEWTIFKKLRNKMNIIRVNGFKEKRKGMENNSTAMVISIRGNGNRAKGMVRAN